MVLFPYITNKISNLMPTPNRTSKSKGAYKGRLTILELDTNKIKIKTATRDQNWQTWKLLH